MSFIVYLRRALFLFCTIGPTVVLFSVHRRPPKSYWTNYTNPWSNRRLFYTSHRNGYLTTNFGLAMQSGLGNQLFEFLALIGIADKLNRIPYIKNDYVLSKVGGHIRQQFPLLQRQLSVVYWDAHEQAVSFNNDVCCVYEDVERLKQEGDEYLQLYGKYFQSYKYFDHLRNHVRNWLLPNTTVQSQVKRKLPVGFKDKFLICVHTRRGDFVTTYWKGPSEPRFSVTALQYLMEKYSRRNKEIGAVILGSDADWEQETFGAMPDIHILENTSVVEEFAFTRLYCDAVLLTAPSSTFGFFIGYLSKRFDVYYRDIEATKDATQKQMYQSDFFPPTWKKLLERNERIKEIRGNL